MPDINSMLVMMGLLFIFLGTLNYLKILKNVNFIGKVMKTEVNKYVYLTVFGILVSFLFSYIFELGYLFLARPESALNLNVISLLLFIGGFFVYNSITDTGKDFFFP
ncbi:hypothetical protein [uncultured Ilyobacter sp.]|uniref:hypothetical protein n=1 Tax=uncultured Ilyobacter sp. TaxID=544433 RepID=UPI0029F4B23C|nr:hypothetical protein [uncultured Ilyobacter sp.]